MTVYGPFISRKQAKACGASHYFTGTPCVRGHIDIRNTKAGDCLGCCRDRQKTPEKRAQQRANYARKKDDPAFREQHNARARASYSRRKEDPANVLKWREKCKAYQATEQGKQKTREAMQRFVRSGKKAAADQLYYATERGQEVRKAARRRHMRKIEAEHGMSYTQVAWKRNPQQKLHARLCNLIATSLKKQSLKKSDKTENLIGCSLKHARKHIESLFTEGMSWDNYGRNGWHFDHIRPVATFELDDNAQLKCCHFWANFQPMWEADNIRKGDTWTPEMETDWAKQMRDNGYEGELFLLFAA